MPGITVASFNTHVGTDGWGRPFDVAQVARELDADVLVLQEVFTPRHGAGQAGRIGEELACSVVELPLATAWRRVDPNASGKGWEPSRLAPPGRKALVVDGQLGRRDPPAGFEEGTWGLAVLSRLPPVSYETLHFGRLRRDASLRAALVVRLSAPTAGARNLTVVGTHMGHLTRGSLLHFLALRRALSALEGPAVLAGDMNLWGPPVQLLLGHWRRAAKGRTWPARRPHSQLDHILVTPEVHVVAGDVVRAGGSDHLPVRARLEWA